MKYVNNTWVMVDKPEDCEARLESIDEYFKGNVQGAERCYCIAA